MRIQNEAGYYLIVELQGRVDIPPDYPGYEHFHPFWELVWADAPIRLRCGGQEIETSAAVLPAGVQHRVVGAGKSSTMLYLGFRFAGGQAEPPRMPLPAPDDEAFTEACRGLLGLPQQEFFAAQSEVLALLSGLVRELSSPAPQIGHRAALTEKVKRLCRSQQNYSVQQMAGMLYVSPNYLGDVFRVETGMRIKEYQTLVRMEEALRLLVSTDLSVAVIAEKVGYTSTSYFIRCFEQRYHRTPGAVRQESSQEKE